MTLPCNELDRILVVMSDIEMGSGGPTDDFPHSDFLGQLILSYGAPAYAEARVELVFNGDTFDLLKTRYQGETPHLVDRDIALAKMTSVAAAHPKFFEAVREFLEGDERRRVHFVVGNHDPELLFPEVQHFIRTLCGSPEQVGFPGFELDIGDVHLEHGQQLDPMFRMNPDRPFIEVDGAVWLNLSWASVAILDVMLPLQHLFYAHDRLKPKKQVLDLVPEIREVLLSSFWTYWRRELLTAYLRRSDPVKRVTWTMLKELVRQFSSPNPDVAIKHRFNEAIRKSDRYRLYVVGHLHQPHLSSYGSRKVIQLGCMRNEYMITDDGEAYAPIPKCYAEIHMNGDRATRSQVLEICGPPDPEGYMPDSIFDVASQARTLLAEEAERERESERRLRQEQEALEADGD